MIRDMNGSVGLSREYGNVSHDTLPYFVVAWLANKEGIGTCRVEWGKRIAAVVEKSDRAALSENWPKCRFSGGSRPVRLCRPGPVSGGKPAV